MIQQKQDIERLLALLDGELQETLDAFIIGGANLIAQGVIERATYDIDVVSPPVFSKGVAAAVQRIAEREKIHKKWINTMPAMDERFLELGWKERSTLFYRGRHLRAFLLSRKDVLGQKLTAAADRTKRDADDILAMNPSEEEWAFAQAWARKYDTNPDWTRWIDQLVKQLKERQYRG